MNGDDSGLSSADSASGRVALTATNPDGEAWEDPWPFAEACPLTSRQISVAERDCACREASFSRRLTIALRRFFRRWLSCLARADTRDEPRV